MPVQRNPSDGGGEPGPLAGWPPVRHQWVQHCAARLAELRVGTSRTLLEHLADVMWFDVSHFDPAMAAELEHESWSESDPGSGTDGSFVSRQST